MSNLWIDDVPSQAKFAPRSDSRAVFLAWERLRIVYNVVLMAETLLLGYGLLGLSEFWILLIIGAIAANVPFCLGVWAEGLLEFIGCPREGARPAIFLLGMGIAMLLTLLAIHDFANGVRLFQM